MLTNFKNILSKHFFISIIALYTVSVSGQTLDLNVLKGKWKGTETREYPDGRKISKPYTITFVSYDTGQFVIQQVFTDFTTGQVDSSIVKVQGDIKPSFLHLVYGQFGLDKTNYCNYILFIRYFYTPTEKKLIVENSNGNENCFGEGFSLVKAEGAEENKTKIEKSVPIEQSNSSSEALLKEKLFGSIHELSDKYDGKVVKVDLSDKDKDWIIKNSGLKLAKNTNIKDRKIFVVNDNEEPFEAVIEAYDFNSDGSYEIILWKHDGSGPMQTSDFTIYYKGGTNGLFRRILNNYGFPEPQEAKESGFKNIEILGPGMQTPLYLFDGIKYRFARNITTEEKQNQEKIPLLGGKTPAELGKILLKALKTNDQKLWNSCIHPTEERYRDLCKQQFQRIKNILEEKGLISWPLVNFSRVTYSKEYMGSQDNGVVSDEQVRRYFVIEFTYKNKEFLGGIGKMTIETYKKGNYFIYFPGYDVSLMRYKKGK